MEEGDCHHNKLSEIYFWTVAYQEIIEAKIECKDNSYIHAK